MGYALWLVPSEGERGALELLMTYRPPWSNKHPHSKRSFPFFTPHITIATFDKAPPEGLLGKLFPADPESEGSRTKTKAYKVEPIQTFFRELTAKPKYLGASGVTMYESKELKKLRDYSRKFLKNLNLPSMSRSFPHCSLFYFDEEFDKEAEKFAKELKKTKRVVKPKGKGVVLNCALDGAPKEFRSMWGFLGTEIWLVDCRKGVSSWAVMDKKILVGPGGELAKEGPGLPPHSPPPSNPSSSPSSSKYETPPEDQAQEQVQDQDQPIDQDQTPQPEDPSQPKMATE